MKTEMKLFIIRARNDSLDPEIKEEIMKEL